MKEIYAKNGLVYVRGQNLVPIKVDCGYKIAAGNIQ